MAGGEAGCSMPTCRPAISTVLDRTATKGELTLYSIFDYGKMIADRVRMTAYADAIDASVERGMTVLDLGTGTGIFALLACRAGARKVYAVDPSPAVELGREIARANRLEDRIDFIQARSSQIDLPGPVDVIVSDMRGIVPFYGTHLSDIIDARNRFLSAGGELIPRRDTLYGALTDAPDQYRDFTTPWSDNPSGFDMTPACRYLINTWKKARAPVCRTVSPPCRWLTIDYATCVKTAGAGRLSWPISDNAAAHGFLLWFETSLAGSCGFSNAPGQPESIYGKAFFPFSEPLELVPGDRVQIGLKAEPVKNEYIWRWTTTHLSQAGEEKKIFEQSTFHANPISRESLKKTEKTYRPQLSDSGKADRLSLELMDGKKTLWEIAELLRGRFPVLFPTARAAFDRVARLSSRYGGDIESP
jgi:protein arginine N-methyltransferase 1